MNSYTKSYNFGYLSTDDRLKGNNNTADHIWTSTLFRSRTYFKYLLLNLFQGLLDRQEFLQWILELVEKCRYPDDPIMRIIMPLMLQYTKEFVQVPTYLNFELLFIFWRHQMASII